MTKYEKEIYTVIHQSNEHLTAEGIFGEVRKRYPGVVLATIYNNINKLWEAGLIRKITMEGSPDRYDGTRRHDHLICKHCGKLGDILFQDLTGSLKTSIGEDILYYDLKVFYVCPECRKIKINKGEEVC